MRAIECLLVVSLDSGKIKYGAASPVGASLQGRTMLVHIRDWIPMARIATNGDSLPRSFLNTVLKRRQAGEAVAMLASIREFTFGSEMNNNYGLNEAFSIEVPSALNLRTNSQEESEDEESEVGTDSEEDEREYSDSSLRVKRIERTQALNFRRLKRILPQSAFPGHILHPFTEWEGFKPGKRKWNEVDLLRAATQITGRSFDGRQLSLDDIQVVLTRLKLCRRLNQNAKPELKIDLR